jgi:hypothetical protein
MKNVGKLEIHYFINSVLLFTHEVDSAYWNEWKLFGFPGDIQQFLVLDIILIMIGLVGFRCVVLKKRCGLWFSLVQAVCGLIAFFLHGVFILKGHAEFTLPMSMILLFLILLTSLSQGILSMRELITNNRSSA